MKEVGEKTEFYRFLVFFFLNKSFKKCIYLWAVLGLCCCLRAFSSCSVRVSHCGGFSGCGAQTRAEAQ